MIDPLDMTLDELRDALGPLLPAQAAFDGWTPAALDAAAAALGVPADRARLAFPDGPVQMIDAWFAAVDRFHASTLMRDYLGTRFVDMFSIVKRVEQDRYFGVVPSLDYDWYLRNA